MNRFLTLLLAASCLTAVGQVTYPYNPDEDGNGQIAVGDLQGILATYGNEFSPSEILVDGETLTTVLTQLQNSIDSLSGLVGSGGSVLDMPLGTILPIATESVPEGWMLCDGREISIEEYQELYDLIGTTYGAGDSAFWAQVYYPATTFNIPDLRGRTIIGANDMGGEQSDVLNVQQASAGQIGGQDVASLQKENLPDINLQFEAGYATSAGTPMLNFRSCIANTNFFFDLGGDSQPFSVMQPYMALNYMMKVRGLGNPLEEIQSKLADIQSLLDSLESPSASEFFVLNGSGQMNYCYCTHCDEGYDKFSEWSFYGESELIAMDIAGEFNTHLSGGVGVGEYWSNSIMIELESELGNTYPCQYQDDEFARIVVPFSGIFRIHVRGNLTAHFPNGNCMQLEQNWRVLKIN